MPSSSLVTLIVLEHNSLKVSRHPDDEIIHGSPMNMKYQSVLKMESVMELLNTLASL